MELRELIAQLALAQGRKIVVFSQWRRMLRLAHWATRDQLALFPTRVVSLPGGSSAYSFTMFQGPGMPDELFDAQYESLKREFANIEAAFA